MKKLTPFQWVWMSVFSLAMPLIAFGVSLLLQFVLDEATLIPATFLLGVFLVAFFTRGYLFGLASALVSVLAVNYAFSFPYFGFDFTLPENIFSVSVMLTVTLLTSTLTSQLKRQEQIRQEAMREKLRADLLRSISHDLRTPLTSIYGSSAALIEHKASLSDAQQTKLLQDIQNEAQWLKQVFENLLSVTKVTADRHVKLNKPPVVLEELVEGVVQRFGVRYPNQKITLHIPDEFVRIPMDAMLIQQVLFNLLENAVLHAKGMQQLTLEVNLCDGGAEFVVLDDGCGIHEEQIHRLFAGEFSPKEDQSSNRGMGIGLSVCAAIVAAHGGCLQATNCPDCGAKFWFVLPIEESDT